jgi:creatinine amidohydrolase
VVPTLARLTSAATSGTDLVLVPVGSLEQHGPHLPLDTDTVIAEAVAHRVAEQLPGAVVAPPIAYGASGEHQAFPGTSSVGSLVLDQVIVELTRSMTTWARRIVFVNGHGGNVGALAAAVDLLVLEGHQVCWVPCADAGGDAHAGRTETSLMLHLRPDSVDLDLASAGNVTPLSVLMPSLLAGGVRAVSENGVLGDPSGATADEGRAVLERMVSRVCEGLARVPA